MRISKKQLEVLKELKREPLMFSEISFYIYKDSASAYRSLKRLIEEGLISKRLVRYSFGKRSFYFITKKGEKFLKKIKTR